MRVNEPITDREVDYPKDLVLVSRTDAKGRITFVNDAFEQVSGFSRDELMGAPHNIVRHPHMPPAAFDDMWQTIKGGDAWEGLVKNRTKTGDHYWVRANVTPLLEDGQVTGYISIRTKPEAAETSAADALYRDIRNGTAGAMKIRHGNVERTTASARFARSTNSLRVRMAIAFGLVLLLFALFGGASILNSRTLADHVEQTRDQSVVPLRELKAISDAYAIFVVDAAHKVRNGNFTWAEGIASVEQAEGAISAGWAHYHDHADAGREAEMIAAAEDLIGPADAAVQDLLGIMRSQDAAALDDFVINRLYQTIDPLTAQIAAIVDLQLEEAEQSATNAHDWFVLGLIEVAILLALSITLATIFGIKLTGNITRPIEQLEAQLRRFIRGNFLVSMPTQHLQEFESISHMLNATRANLAYAERERGQNELLAAEQRQIALRRMADTVESEAGAAVDQVGMRTSAMADEARAMADGAQRMSGNAATVATAAQDALSSAQTVAAAGEQLTASIQEISAQVARSSAVTQSAVMVGSQTSDKISQLSTEVTQIGEIVELIRNIAAQTNLLALNATIEAARAGEAGKGFAVVASEVKNLANQTAESTERITRQIDAVNQATEKAVTSVGEMSQAVSEIDEISAAIAAAMEEQAAATSEISRSIHETSDAAQQVAERIESVSTEAQNTGERTGAVMTASQEVAHSIEVLRNTLVSVVRNADDSADRRQDQRFDLDEQAELVGTGRSVNGRVLNISRGGALVEVPDGQQSPLTGVLRISRGGVEAAYEVVGSTRGSINLRFRIPTSSQAAFEAAFSRLTKDRTPATSPLLKTG